MWQEFTLREDTKQDSAVNGKRRDFANMGADANSLMEIRSFGKACSTQNTKQRSAMCV